MVTPPPINKAKNLNSEYFINVNNEQKGPYDFEKIKVLLEFKNIDETSLICEEGMKEWDNILNK